MTPFELPSLWRARAERLREYAPAAATAFQEAAAELEQGLQAEANEVLTLRQASEYCGYSRDHLRRLVREGRLTNMGRKHAPRVRRGDLPRRPGRFDEPLATGYDPVADARQVAARRAHPGGGS